MNKFLDNTFLDEKYGSWARFIIFLYLLLIILHLVFSLVFTSE